MFFSLVRSFSLSQLVGLSSTAGASLIIGDLVGVAGSLNGVTFLAIQVRQGLIEYYDPWTGCHGDVVKLL